MQLDERKARILSAIVEMFVSTGEPVGSKALAAVFDNAFSSATIRNEMAALADLGLIGQPHTSSGRVPTQRGYRLYVDQLMPRRQLSEEERARIDAMARQIAGQDAEKILADAGAVLAELTHCAAVTTTPDLTDSVIRQIDVVPVAPHAVVLVVVLSTSTAQSRLVRTDEQLSVDLLEKFSRFCGQHFVNRTVEEMTPAVVQSTSALMGEHSLLPLFAALCELCGDLCEGRVLLEGQQHLLEYDQPFAAVRELFSFLARRQELLRLLTQQRDPLHVTIGAEAERDELAHSTLIVARYSAGKNLSGNIGVIGPTRMDYSQIIARLAYFTKLVGKLLEDSYK